MSRIVWDCDQGWHDGGEEARVRLDEHGRLRIEPLPKKDAAPKRS